MKAQIAEITIEILKAMIPLFALLVSYLGLKLNKYLTAKIKDEELKTTMTKVNSIILDVVKDVEQSYVKKEKADKHTEKLPTECAEIAKGIALDKAKFQLGDKLLKELKKKNLTASEEEFLKTKIEATIFDMRKAKIAILPFIFFFFVGCTPATTLTANTIKAHDDIIRMADTSVAKWFTERSTECFKKGIEIKLAAKDTTVANNEGYEAYKSCIKHPTEVATEIADIIDDIRKDNKELAKVALDVAKRIRPDSDLGSVNEKFNMKFKRLRHIVVSENIQ